MNILELFEFTVKFSMLPQHHKYCGLCS
jgi:hypothetical protein